MIWRMAYRNIWRNKKRTGLTLLAMVLSAGLLIFLLAISEGMVADLLLNATRQYTGQAVVMNEDYRADQDFFAVIDDPDAVGQVLAANPAVLGASPRLRTYGLFSHGTETVSGEILGVDWAAESRVTILRERLTAGRYPSAGDGRGMLIGAGMAQRLKVAVGGEVVLVTQAADGSIGNDLFTVEGIFKTGDFSRDNYLALAGRATLSGTLALEGKAHEIAMDLRDPETATETAALLEATLRRTRPGLAVVSWQTLLPILAQARELFDKTMIITTVIIYLAAGMVVVNTIFMSFYERLREFGMLMAVGMTPWQIRRLLIAEAMALGLLAAVLGAALGAALSLYTAYHPIDISAFLKPVSFGGGSVLPVIRASLSARGLLIPFIGMFLVSLGAVIFPAFQGGRRPPAEDLTRGGA